MRKKLISLSLMIISATCYSATYFVNEDDVREVPCSSKGITEISMDEDIDAVITQDHSIDYQQLDKHKSKLFINNLSDKSPLFITTTQGKTIALILTPSNMIVENHYLIMEKEHHSSFIEKIIAGKIPRGYKEEFLYKGYESHPFYVKNVAAYNGEHYQILKISIKNITDRKVFFDELQVDHAIDMRTQKDILNPHETCYAWILKKKN